MGGVLSHIMCIWTWPVIYDHWVWFPFSQLNYGLALSPLEEGNSGIFWRRRGFVKKTLLLSNGFLLANEHSRLFHFHFSFLATACWYLHHDVSPLGQ